MSDLSSLEERESKVPSRAPAKRKSEEHDLVAEILLCKGAPESPSTNKENGLAPIFCKPVAKKKEEKTFSQAYRNAFHRKRDVNLYIRDGQVVWEFAYNKLVIQAIKEHIKGRTWNPSLGIKGCWTCPLESLPDAIALYEFMGRTADESLKKRAKEIEESFGGTSASDAIKLAIQLSLKRQATADGNDAVNSIGSVLVTFLYDAEVVSALKMLSPVQRSYNPSTKAWTVDMLALPELLEHLEPLGYTPSTHLVDVANSCSDLQNLLWGEESPAAGSQSEPIDVTVESSDEPQSHVTSESDKAQLLEAALKKLIALVGQKSEEDAGRKLDRSDCGESKRRRLTGSQLEWSERRFGDYDSDDDVYGYASFFSDDRFSSFARNHLRQTKTRDTTPTDCDCGKPWKRVGGKHVCRYFGTFHCGCGNQWTSAYCWKGEKQACQQLDVQCAEDLATIAASKTCVSLFLSKIYVHCNIQ